MIELDENGSDQRSRRAPDEDLSLISLFRLIWQNKWLIVIVVGLCVLSTTLLSFLLTPKFRSTVLLAPVEIDSAPNVSSLLGSQIGGLASIAGLSTSVGSKKEEMLALLLSRAFTTQFIREQGLLPVLFSDKWDSQTESWIPDEVPTFQDAFKKFDEDIRSINVNRQSGLISLSILWRDRRQASDWALSLVERANYQIRHEVILESQESISFLEDELERTTIVDVRAGIFELMGSHIKKIMLANVRDEYAFRILDPPVVSDSDKYVSPNHILFALLGIIFGVLIVTLLLYVRTARNHTT